MKSSKQNNVTKDGFFRALHNETNFTYDEIKYFWNAVETIFQNSILTETTLNLPGFGKLYVTNIKAGRYWDGINKKYVERPANKRLVFKISRTLKNLLSEDADYGDLNDIEE